MQQSLNAYHRTVEKSIRRLLAPLLRRAGAESVSEAIFRASVLNILTKAFTFLRYTAIAIAIGINGSTDVFFMAISVMGIYNTSAEALDSLGVPKLVRLAHNPPEHDRLVGSLLTFSIVVGLAMTLAAAVTLPISTKLAVGFTQSQSRLLLTYTYLMVPFVLFYFIFHCCGTVLRAQQYFTPFFAGQLIFAVCTLAVISAGFAISPDPVILPISFTVAQVAASAYVFTKARNYLSFAYHLDRNCLVLLKEYGGLLIPYGFVILTVLVDKIFGSLLPPKTISALTFALVLTQTPSGILRVDKILITPLAKARDNGALLRTYVSRLLAFAAPITVATFCFARPIVHILYGYGAFKGIDQALTAEALRYFALTIPASLVWPAIFSTYQIRNRLGRVNLVMGLGIALLVALDYLLVVRMHGGIRAVPTAQFISGLVTASLAYWSLPRTEAARPDPEHAVQCASL